MVCTKKDPVLAALIELRGYDLPKTMSKQFLNDMETEIAKRKKSTQKSARK